MEIQKQILCFLSNHHSSFLDFLAQFFTVFGESLIPFSLVMIVFWCIDKKKGLICTLIFSTAMNLMSLIKAIVRFPRPWTVIPELNTLRLSTATGYSFPSGHTTTAASFYSAMACSFRKKKLSVVCAFLILAVGLSRLYLCVHWPMDVMCGIILGIGTTAIFFNSDSSNSEKPVLFTAIGLFMLLSALVMVILIDSGKIDHTAFSDFSKSLCMQGAFLLGYPLEEKYVKFSTEGTLKVKIFRTVFGLIGAVFFVAVLKLFIPYTAFWSFVRYTSMVFWVVLLYPLIGKKFKLFSVTALTDK